MTAKIEYIFSCISPWAYLGHMTFLNIAKTYNAEIAYKPVMLMTVFQKTGGQPLAQRAECRQNYRLIELQRWREARNVDLNLHPKFWPFNASLADRVVIAADKLGHPLGDFTHQCMRAVWYENKNLADQDHLFEIAQSCNLPTSECLEKAENSDVKETYEQYTQQAIAHGSFGSPTYVLNGEVFWGQDRLDLLEAALKTQRAPYTSKDQ